MYVTLKKQNEYNWEVATTISTRYDKFIGRIDTVDESWARSYEPNLKH